MAQIDSYDSHKSRPTVEILSQSARQLEESLIKLHYSTTPSTTPNSYADPFIVKDPKHPDKEVRKVELPDVPPELIAYVDGGRNPDIYTREFVELARRSNQLMKGKEEAFGGFRDVLAEVLGEGNPELKGDVERVVVATGGKARR